MSSTNDHYDRGEYKYQKDFEKRISPPRQTIILNDFAKDRNSPEAFNHRRISSHVPVSDEKSALIGSDQGYSPANMSMALAPRETRQDNAPVPYQAQPSHFNLNGHQRRESQTKSYDLEFYPSKKSSNPTFAPTHSKDTGRFLQHHALEGYHAQVLRTDMLVKRVEKSNERIEKGPSLENIATVNDEYIKGL